MPIVVVVFCVKIMTANSYCRVFLSTLRLFITVAYRQTTVIPPIPQVMVQTMPLE